MDLREQSQMSVEEELNHWWIRTRLLYLRRFLSSLPPPVDVLEVGCGTAQNLVHIRRNPELDRAARRVTGVEPDWPADATRGSWMKPNDEIHRSLGEVRGAQDVLVAMDVLEHIDDDAGALDEWLGHVRPGGHVFLTVPALPSLWSYHDVLLLHKRRYTLESLTKLTSAAGLECVASAYAFSYIAPAAYLLRKLGSKNEERTTTDLSPTPGPINAALYAAGYVEASIGGNPLFGTSVIGRYRRP